MTIVTYSNMSDNNVVNKELSQLNSFTGTLRESTDLLNPTIRLTNIPTNSLTKMNYLYSPELGRYYFVTNIQIVRENVFDIECHVDVLMTYAAEIKAQTAVIKRQENLWNLYLDDGIFKVYNNPNIVTKAFPSGFTTQNFVLAVAGN